MKDSRVWRPLCSTSPPPETSDSLHLAHVPILRERYEIRKPRFPIRLLLFFFVRHNPWSNHDYESVERIEGMKSVGPGQLFFRGRVYSHPAGSSME